LAQQEQALPSTQPAPQQEEQVSTTVSTSLGDMRTANDDIVVADDDNNAQGEILFNMICLIFKFLKCLLLSTHSYVVHDAIGSAISNS
jgi:hypothetical protein